MTVEKQVKVSSSAVRYGASYGGNKLFASARGSGRAGGGGGFGGGFGGGLGGGFGGGGFGGGFGGVGLSRAVGLGGAAGGAAFGFRSGLRGGFGAGAGAGFGLGAGIGVGGRAGGALGVLKGRIGVRGFKVGSYGGGPSLLFAGGRAGFGGPGGLGGFGGPGGLGGFGGPGGLGGGPGGPDIPSIDPSLPSVDTVQVTRIKERDELQGLNNKFASFIDKVRSLEQQNTILKAQINLYNRSDPSGPANAGVVATTAVAGYKAQVETLSQTKAALLAEIDHYKVVIEEIQSKFDDDSANTKSLEAEWTTLKEDVDHLYLTIFDLQTKLTGVEDQITLSKQLYDAKVREVQTIITSGTKAAVSISFDNYAQAQDLSSAISDMRSQYELLVAKTKQEAFAVAESKIHLVSGSTQPTVQALTAYKEEYRTVKLQVDAVQREIERVKSVNIQLESSIAEAETSSTSEVDTYQEQAVALKSQLDDVRKQIAHYGQEYQDLLATKMGLDVEITAYKKLMDSEELRLSSGSGITVHMSKSSFGGAAGGGGGGGAGLGGGFGGGAGGGLGGGLGLGGGFGGSLGGGLGGGFGGGLGGGLGGGSGLSLSLGGGGGGGGGFGYGSSFGGGLQFGSLNSSSISTSTVF